MPFPTSLPSYATILSNTEMDDTGFEHDVMHNAVNDDVEAIGAKIGTGASTPTANKVLRATGTGTSAWGQVATGDVTDNAITIRPAVAVGSTDPSTTNTTPAALANPTLSITIPTGMTADVYVWVTGSVLDSTTGSIIEYHLRIASGSWTSVCQCSGWNGRTPLAGFHKFTGITAGTHTIEVGNSSNTGNTIVHYGTPRRLMAIGIAK